MVVWFRVVEQNISLPISLVVYRGEHANSGQRRIALFGIMLSVPRNILN